MGIYDKKLSTVTKSTIGEYHDDPYSWSAIQMVIDGFILSGKPEFYVGGAGNMITVKIGDTRVTVQRNHPILVISMT